MGIGDEIVTSLNINNNDYETRVKLNEILYLQQIDNNNNGKKFKFKKIYINNITSSFIYVLLGPNIVADRISNCQWNYPDIDYLFSKLGDMCDWIYMILFFSFPLFKLHVKNELAYKEITLGLNIIDNINNIEVKKQLFGNIFKIYGSFEKGLTESRFSLYIIQLFFLFTFMLKRIYFGGFNKSSHLLIIIIIDIIFLIQNIVYIIMDFLLILFTIFSIICYYKNEYDRISDDIMDAKFFMQLIINIIMLNNNIRLLKENIIITKYLNQLRKAMDRFIKKEDNIDDDEPNFKPVEFEYVSLEGVICTIKEFKSDLLQRNLFYTMEHNGKDNDKNINSKIGDEIVIHQEEKNYEQIVINNETNGMKEENNPPTETNLK